MSRCLLTLLVFAAAARNAVGWRSEGSAVVSRRDFGSKQIWRLSDDAISELHKCSGTGRLDCVHKVMRRRGASEEAWRFYRRTGWFLSDLKDLGGRVGLASLVNPWSANENEQPAIVGGKPAVVYPENVKVSPDSDAGFQAIRAEFPALLFWKPSPEFESNTITAEGESLVFRYRLLDGCHACAVRGWARVEFVFGPDGTYRRAKLLGVVRP